MEDENNYLSIVYIVALLKAKRKYSYAWWEYESSDKYMQYL